MESGAAFKWSGAHPAARISSQHQEWGRFTPLDWYHLLAKCTVAHVPVWQGRSGMSWWVPAQWRYSSHIPTGTASIPGELLPGLAQIRGCLSEYRNAWIGSMFISTNYKKESQLRMRSWCQQNFFIVKRFSHPQIRLLIFMINDRESDSENRIVWQIPEIKRS